MFINLSLMIPKVQGHHSNFLKDMLTIRKVKNIFSNPIYIVLYSYSNKKKLLSLRSDIKITIEFPSNIL